LYRRFASKAAALLAAETGAWERWNAREGNLLIDRMHRGLRLLQEARRMDFAELLFLSSFARAGVYAGIFPVSLPARLEELRVKAQPFHLAATRQEDLAATRQEAQIPQLEDELALRADLARALLADI
jgi:protein-arginine kinase